MWQAIKCFFGYHEWTNHFGDHLRCAACFKQEESFDDLCDHEWVRIEDEHDPCHDFDMCNDCGETREAVIDSRHKWERVTNVPNNDGHLSVRCTECDLVTHWDRTTKLP